MKLCLHNNTIFFYPLDLVKVHNDHGIHKFDCFLFIKCPGDKQYNKTTVINCSSRLLSVRVAQLNVKRLLIIFSAILYISIQ